MIVLVPCPECGYIQVGFPSHFRFMFCIECHEPVPLHDWDRPVGTKKDLGKFIVWWLSVKGPSTVEKMVDYLHQRGVPGLTLEDEIKSILRGETIFTRTGSKWMVKR